MSIEAVFERIATALERIAANTGAQVTVNSDAPAAVSQAAEATGKKRGPGRPPKAEKPTEPAKAPEPEKAPEPVKAPEPEKAPEPKPAPAEEPDDFLDTEPPKEATIEDVRAALIAYGEVTSRDAARAKLKDLSGKDNLTSFTDKSQYGAFVAELQKLTAAAKAK